VIVRDRGSDWQVVLQTDHADLSAGAAAAWADRGARHASLEVATVRHDDGWAIWEQAPRFDEEDRPVNFLDVDVTSHLTFYRACITAVSEQDPYAGLLVSMHGAGIYRQRFGRDVALGLTRAPEVQELVETFVAEQEAGFDARLAQTGASDDDRWRDYELLQLYDCLSLSFCMHDVEAREAEPVELQGYRLELVAPWRMTMTPFPFVESPARFSLLRRVVPKGTRPDLLALPAERVEVTIESSSRGRDVFRVSRRERRLPAQGSRTPARAEAESRRTGSGG
jgi:hypothetical protein